MLRNCCLILVFILKFKSVGVGIVFSTKEVHIEVVVIRGHLFTLLFVIAVVLAVLLALLFQQLLAVLIGTRINEIFGRGELLFATGLLLLLNKERN